MEYFEIFLSRMQMCRHAAEHLDARFRLVINSQEARVKNTRSLWLSIAFVLVLVALLDRGTRGGYLTRDSASTWRWVR